MPVPRHYLKYVTWENVERWRRRVVSEGGTIEAAYPYAFGSRDDAVLGFAGQVLWLVTLPKYRGYRQAPSLVARLEIESTGKDDGSERFAHLDREVRLSGPNIVFARHQPDAYFPLNNVFHTLLGLEFDGRSRRIPDVRLEPGSRAGGPYVTLAGYFQRHRRLAESSVPELERYGAAVRAGRRVFLSYKRSDFPAASGPAWPEQLGAELSSRDVSCWWDRWYLPQGEAFGQARLDDDLLSDLLADAVRQAVWLVALIRPDLLAASDESWPRREWQRAAEERSRSVRRHGMRRVAVFFTDVVSEADVVRWVQPGDHQVVLGSHASPVEAAEAIARVIASG